MKNSLKQLLDEKKCFKLICGANNENYKQITKLTALYSAAGCRFFDINASIDAIKAAKEGFEYSNAKDCLICISTGANDDPHLSKYKINQDLCQKCEKCLSFCLQGAIYKKDGQILINEKKCIGCKKCALQCFRGAIEKYQKTASIEDITPEIMNQCDCIELHIVSNNLFEVEEKWQYLCSNFDGFLSISINCSLFSRKTLIEQLQKMIAQTDKKRIIIQADGCAMTGIDNDFRTTLQAVACADIIKKANLGTPIITSGGVNLKTKELLKQFNIDIEGVAMGSYARKAVKDYIDCDDFLSNKDKFNAALKIAKDIVNTCS